MKIENRVASVLDGSASIISQASVVIHIQQDCARVAQQPVRPVRNHEGTNDPGRRIHPDQAKPPCEQETNNRQNRDGSVSHYMNIGGADVVIPRHRSMHLRVMPAPV